MKFLKKNFWSIVIVLALSCLSFFYISQKEGFHEDEIFSYGSSNYRYDNIYKSFGASAADLDYFHNHIVTLSFPNNLTESINFLTHKDDYRSEFDETLKKEIPIWKTKEDLLNYLTIQKSDLGNYFSVWLNQTIDVHPPLFYFLVHFASGFSMNHFTKYTIFMVNFLFFLFTLLGIYKIMKNLTHKKWANLAMVCYGASLGAMSTLLFQRMYMMLTAFSVWYLYYTLKFLQKDFTKKEKIIYSLIIFCGFLTQYYFCIYCVLLFGMAGFFLGKEKQFKKLKTLFFLHLIPAGLGILFFPASIVHIFFSYRGLGSTSNKSKSFFEMLLYFIESLGESIGLSTLLFLILFAILMLILIRKKVRAKNFILLFVPLVLFVLCMAKLSPFLGSDYTSRYIMPMYPILVIAILFMISSMRTRCLFPIATSCVLALSIFQNITHTPTYLFNDYKEAIQISKTYQDQYFLYVFDNYFTHLKDLPEMMNYQKHKIVNHNIFDFATLKEDKELNKQDSFILCFKGWIDFNPILEEITENTDFKKITFIKGIQETTSSYYYKLSK